MFLADLVNWKVVTVNSIVALFETFVTVTFESDIPQVRVCVCVCVGKPVWLVLLLGALWPLCAHDPGSSAYCKECWLTQRNVLSSCCLLPLGWSRARGTQETGIWTSGRYPWQLHEVNGCGLYNMLLFVASTTVRGVQHIYQCSKSGVLTSHTHRRMWVSLLVITCV